MKRIIGIILLLLTLSVTVFAGSVPEDLLNYDEAQLFFGEVLAYNDRTVTVCPRVKIKGDVYTGTQQHYDKPLPVGGIKVKPGNIYLFTYFDENNETYIFEASSYDIKTLKLKNVTGDMWERFEKYLNDGEYEKAEQKRIDKLNEQFELSGEQISLTEYTGVDREITHTTVSFYMGKTAFEVEKKDFLKISDSIMLKKINEQDVNIEGRHGIYLSPTESENFTYISSDGKVGRSNPTKDMILHTEYIIEASDIAKLKTLIPEKMQEKLPPMKSVNANLVYWIIANPTSAFAIGLLLIIVLIGALGFGIGYKIRKKKTRR